MKIKESSYLTIKFFGRVHSEQWFPNFISSRTIVGPILSARTTLFQENSIFQILFDQKFGKQN